MIRFFDIIFSITALIFFAPIFLIIIIILKVTGEGEIFYFQKRVGLDAKEFRLFKFATMIKNSENIGSGTITIDNDFRVLPFGKILRKSKINEMPQIINVLIGDMSLIGPRPLVRSGFDSYPPDSIKKMSSIKPGLSGLSSIMLRNEEEILSKVDDPILFHSTVLSKYKSSLEIWYHDRNNLLNYFLLIFITVWKIFFRNSRVVEFIFKNIPSPPKELSLIDE